MTSPPPTHLCSRTCNFPSVPLPTHAHRNPCLRLFLAPLLLVMAVQAQYLSHAFPCDLRAIRVLDNAASGCAFFESEPGGLLAGAGQQVVVGNTVFSDVPRSELTCNDNSGFVPRKRARVVEGGVMDGRPTALLPPVPQGLVSGDVQSRVVGSGAASTSGRLDNAALLSHGMLTHLYQQSVEMDALIRLENERLRAELEEARRRHVRAVVSAVERAAARRLWAAEAELQRARGRNAELEEEMRQMGAEVQAWLGLAKSHEAVAASLRATVDQLLQSPCGASGGDAEDAQSCCFDTAAVADDATGQRAKMAPCKACGQGEACMLLLPCRHLCLCRECEAAVDACPVCAATKNASLHVLLS